MALLFGQLADPIHEVQRLAEAAEAESLLQVVPFNQFSVRYLTVQPSGLGTFERQNVALAKHARLAGEFRHCSAPFVVCADEAKCSS
jgi:hypothetical protein